MLLDKKASLESRVAALFTYKQIVGSKANPALAKVARENAALREWALRSLADRKTQLADVPKELLA